MAMKRNKFIAKLKEKGVHVVGTTEEFNGSKGGVWCSAESGGDAFNYYAFDFGVEEEYPCGVKKEIEQFANDNGWFFEWNDCGTVMAWEL